MSGFEIEGMDELQRNFNSIVTRGFPKETEKFMKKEASKLVRRMKKLAESRVNRVSGNYMRGFKRGRKVYKWSDNSMNIRTYNSSPHAHLIEDGYRLTAVNGKFIRFIPGKHVIADAAKEFEDQFAKDVENDMVDYIIKQLEK